MEVLGVLLRLVLAQHTVIVALATRVELLERGSSLHITVAREARFGHIQNFSIFLYDLAMIE